MPDTSLISHVWWRVISMAVQRNVSGNLSRCPFQTGGCSRRVQFARNPIVDGFLTNWSFQTVWSFQQGSFQINLTVQSNLQWKTSSFLQLFFLTKANIPLTRVYLMHFERLHFGDILGGLLLWVSLELTISTNWCIPTIDIFGRCGWLANVNSLLAKQACGAVVVVVTKRKV